MKYLIPLAWPVVFIAAITATAAEIDDGLPWDVKMLSQPPRMYPASDHQAEGVRGLFYEGLSWKGKPTRVFAWYGVPEKKNPGKKFPAMVLAHGGGGTAFDEWVRKWNRRGYAAIAMDLEGTLPVGKYPNRPGHEWSGPMRSGSFQDLDQPAKDQWFYHAVADIVLAHSWLRSLTEVDPDRIGLTGISWGGILTCTTVGVDHRFKLAIPVYGCGFLTEAPIFGPLWESLGPESVRQWNRLWDPARYLPRARTPMLWVNGSNDRHFPLNHYSRSYALAAVPKTLCVRVGMHHGHAPGWQPEEIYAFAESILRDGQPLTRVRAQGRAGGKCWITFEAPSPLDRAELIYATDVDDWVKCRWIAKEATVHPAGNRAEVDLPGSCAAYFFNLTDKRGLLVSSPVETIPLTSATERARSRPAPTQSEGRSPYPAFTWDRVPVAAHLGKPSGHFTEQEAQFLATHFPIVTIEKTQSMRTPAKGERAIYRAARLIKRFNPKTKVLFYWNGFLAYPMYDAHKTFIQHPEWALNDRQGKPVLIRKRVPAYDLSNRDVRTWWADVARKATADSSCDGVFVDALPKIGMLADQNRRVWGSEKYDSVEAGLHGMLAATRQQIGPDKLLIYNGLRGNLEKWPDGGARYLRFADGAMVEHFGWHSGRDSEGRIKPSQMEADIKLIREAGLAGKIVIVKGWPNLNALPKTSNHETKARLARESLTFPLAAFLIAAEEHAYFAYSWGYHDTDGWLEWYPEFDRPLGSPKGPARREGWEYRREFEHASVWVDIEHEKADILWHKRGTAH